MKKRNGTVDHFVYSVSAMLVTPTGLSWPGKMVSTGVRAAATTVAAVPAMPISITVRQRRDAHAPSGKTAAIKPTPATAGSRSTR